MTPLTPRLYLYPIVALPLYCQKRGQSTSSNRSCSTFFTVDLAARALLVEFAFPSSLRRETHPVTRQATSTLNAVDSKFVSPLKIPVFLCQS